jgi:formiminotetrahydrofolate cyclodeaminase
VAQTAAAIAQMVERLKPITNPNMGSDLTTATALAQAALKGAMANVEINLGSMKPGTPEEEDFVSRTRSTANALLA